MSRTICRFAVSVLVGFLPSLAAAQNVQPGTAYIYPAGGQRGTEVLVVIGGYNLTPSTQLYVEGTGVEQRGVLQPRDQAPPVPYIKRDMANRPFNYAREMTAMLRIAADAPLGARPWQVWTAHGGTLARPFVVGDLPEIVEGADDKSPRRVTLPVTANGRIALAEEVDGYVFRATQGEPIACELVAERIGSTLDARLSVLGPGGQEIAAAEDSRGLDPMVNFVAADTGDYTVRVHDFAYSGLPSHVYRLTLRKTGPASAVADAKTDEIRAIDVNASQAIEGRLMSNRQRFQFTGIKSHRISISVEAARLGASLDTQLTVCDPDGKELARNDDVPGTTDSEVEFVVPADGAYLVTLTDLAGAPRTADQSAYRLRVAQAMPGFALQLTTDHVDVAPGAAAQLTVKVLRHGGFDGEINLELAGLPTGVMAEPLTIKAKQNDHKVSLKAATEAGINATPLRVSGSATIDGQTVKRDATVQMTGPGPVAPISASGVLLTVTHPARFKIVADDTYFFRSRGTTHPAKIRIEREPGFDGDVIVSLADMQVRYLQGIRAPEVTVPAGVSEVIYPLFVPESVELNRTCRVLVAGKTAVKSADGRTHHLLAVSPKQCVMRMEPAILAVQAKPECIETAPGRAVEVKIQVQRALDYQSPVRIELVTPEGASGISAEPIEIAADQTNGVVTLHIDSTIDMAGQDAIRFRATAQQEGLPVVAETLVELRLNAHPPLGKSPQVGANLRN
jgi:hypothetical protein